MPGVVLAAAGSETVAVAIAVVATLVVVGLVVAVAALVREAVALRRETDELRRVATEVLHELDAVVRDTAGRLERAGADLDRVDELIGSAESISQAVGTASRLASIAVSGPLIKAVALGSGAVGAGRRLRRSARRGGRARARRSGDLGRSDLPPLRAWSRAARALDPPAAALDPPLPTGPLRQPGTDRPARPSRGR